MGFLTRPIERRLERNLQPAAEFVRRFYDLPDDGRQLPGVRFSFAVKIHGKSRLKSILTVPAMHSSIRNEIVFNPLFFPFFLTRYQAMAMLAHELTHHFSNPTPFGKRLQELSADPKLLHENYDEWKAKMCASEGLAVRSYHEYLSKPFDSFTDLGAALFDMGLYTLKKELSFCMRIGILALRLYGLWAKTGASLLVGLFNPSSIHSRLEKCGEKQREYEARCFYPVPEIYKKGILFVNDLMDIVKDPAKVYRAITFTDPPMSMKEIEFGAQYLFEHKRADLLLGSNWKELKEFRQMKDNPPDVADVVEFNPKKDGKE